MSSSSVILLLAYEFLFYSRRIEEIRQDAEAWRNTSRLNAFWSRDKIKAAIALHEKNLKNCFDSFMVSNQNLCLSERNVLSSPSSFKIGTSFQLGVAADNRAGERRPGGRSDSNSVVLGEYWSYRSTPVWFD